MKEMLHILYGEIAVGSLVYDRKKDEITLIYEQVWQFGAESFPISLSLPLARKSHPDAAIRPFLQGLLPDNPAVIEAWGKRFHVSPRNPFDVIKHVGEDCAGALQFVRPERLQKILSGELDSLIPLTEADLEKRMKDIAAQSRAIPVPIEGRFSLAGAQTKDALHLKDGRWFVPAGRIPSTHILKPQLEEFEEHALNENFCLRLASRVGLSSAESRILDVAGKRVLCVERYDRVTYEEDGPLVRWHQEDMCQALGRYPHQKYQADGGPSAGEIVKLLYLHSDDHESVIVQFIGALAFNWVIAGTDAHSKNYSLIHGRGSLLLSAPLYDLASFLPYQRDANSTKVKLAMKIGGTYRLHEIDATRWKKWALEGDLLTPEGVVEIVQLTVQEVLKSIGTLEAEIYQEYHSKFVGKLADAIKSRAIRCAELME